VVGMVERPNTGPAHKVSVTPRERDVQAHYTKI
jgi:hypothetical protein